jgi:hypothetical protein
VLATVEVHHTEIYLNETAGLDYHQTEITVRAATHETLELMVGG